MISLELLRQTGNAEALITLTEDDELSVGELAGTMGLHESTVRQRMNDLEDAGLVNANAELVDGQPVRVWETTEQGEQLATSLLSLLNDYTAGDRSPKADATDESTKTEADD